MSEVTDSEVISLSSDSSRPNSPFFNISDVFNNSEKRDKSSLINCEDITALNVIESESPLKTRIVHALSESEESDNEFNKSTNFGIGLGVSHTEVNRLWNKYSGNRRDKINYIDTLKVPPCILSEQSSSKRDVLENRNIKTTGLNSKKINKEERENEKLRKQKEKEQKKAEKLAAKELQNYMKPGHCIKVNTSLKWNMEEVVYEIVYKNKTFSETKYNTSLIKLVILNDSRIPIHYPFCYHNLVEQWIPVLLVHESCVGFFSSDLFLWGNSTCCRPELRIIYNFMTVMLDSSLVTCSFGGTLLAAVQNSESKYQVSSHSVPHTIFWKRELPGPSLKEEAHLVVIWQWQFVIPVIKNHTLCVQIRDIKTQYPGKSVYLVIYGINGYFSYLKSKRRNNSGDLPKRRKGGSEENEYPYVTRKDIEEELIELQIMTSCNHRLIESPEDLGQFIVQITKAIAETPFKMDKQRRELESLEWFAVGDSRDCVMVDKNGNGLLRLWQQQLCQFNLAGHDVAQAIAVVYPSPQALVTAYDKCNSQKEAEELLKDIPVRRCQGPLSSSRRIGPELSKKICTFFCSTEGSAPLSQEQ